MSTSTTLHVMTPDDGAVTSELSAWLEATHRAPVTAERLTGFPPDFYSTAGFIPDETPPTWFVIAREQPDWATVHFNSFAELSDLSRRVSARLECMTVTLIAQSVTEAYFLQVFASGDHLRTLAWVGESGEWLRDEGEPLPFERSNVRTATDEDDEEDEELVFGREEVEAYCRALGLRVWQDSGSLPCLSLSVPRRVAPPLERVARGSEKKRKWWQLWR